MATRRAVGMWDGADKKKPLNLTQVRKNSRKRLDDKTSGSKQSRAAYIIPAGDVDEEGIEKLVNIVNEPVDEASRHKNQHQASTLEETMPIKIYVCYIYNELDVLARKNGCQKLITGLAVITASVGITMCVLDSQLEHWHIFVISANIKTKLTL